MPAAAIVSAWKTSWYSKTARAAGFGRLVAYTSAAAECSTAPRTSYSSVGPLRLACRRSNRLGLHQAHRSTQGTVAEGDGQGRRGRAQRPLTADRSDRQSLRGAEAARCGQRCFHADGWDAIRGDEAKASTAAALHEVRIRRLRDAMALGVVVDHIVRLRAVSSRVGKLNGKCPGSACDGTVADTRAATRTEFQSRRGLQGWD